jgi:hypothetical protein
MQNGLTLAVVDRTNFEQRPPVNNGQPQSGPAKISSNFSSKWRPPVTCSQRLVKIHSIFKVNLSTTTSTFIKMLITFHHTYCTNKSRWWKIGDHIMRLPLYFFSFFENPLNQGFSTAGSRPNNRTWKISKGSQLKNKGIFKNTFL